MERGQLDNMRQSLLDEGFLGEIFVHSERLQTEADPNFVEEMISKFYTTDSVRCLQNIEQALEKTPVDFFELDNLMSRFYAYCSILGASRVTNKCNEFREYCRARNGNLEGCKMAFQQLKEVLETLKGKLEAYFLVFSFYLMLGRQVRAAEAAGGANRAVDQQNGVSL